VPGVWVDKGEYDIQQSPDWSHGVVLLDAIHRIGYDGSSEVWDPSIYFEYETADGVEAAATEELNVTRYFDYSKEDTNALAYKTESKTDGNETCQSSGFFDLNGDGLKEFVAREDGVWRVRGHELDEDGNSSWAPSHPLADQHLHDINRWGSCLSLNHSWGHPDDALAPDFIEEWFGVSP